MLLHKRYSLDSSHFPSPFIIKSLSKNPNIFSTMKTPKLKSKKLERSPRKSSLYKTIKLPEIINSNSKVSELSDEILDGIKIQQIKKSENFQQNQVILGYSTNKSCCVVYREFSLQTLTRKRLQLYTKLGNNQYVVQLLGIQIKKQDKGGDVVYIITQYAMAGSLLSIIKSFGCIPIFSLKKLIGKLLIGLIFIHSKKVAHMDLQSDKIFIDSKSQLKIGGWFNKCQVFNQKKKGIFKIQQLTPYTPPQQILSEQFEVNHSYDIWYVGCLIIQLCSGKPLVLSPNTSLTQRKQQLLDHSFYSKYLFNYPSELKAVASKCFQINPTKRLKARQLLQMSFFNYSNK